MADFHRRFPDLRRLEPPSLTRKDPSIADGKPGVLAAYDPKLHAIGFSEVEAMLQANVYGSQRHSLSTLRLPYDASFSLRLGKLARHMGIGDYAGQHPFEFAAEAIGWRLNPGYGATADTPRMPPYLENWVHHCFPFLDNGLIPEPAFLFDPDYVKVPVYRDRAVEWIPMGEWRAIEEDRQPGPDASSGAEGYSK